METESNENKTVYEENQDLSLKEKPQLNNNANDSDDEHMQSASVSSCDIKADEFTINDLHKDDDQLKNLHHVGDEGNSELNGENGDLNMTDSCLSVDEVTSQDVPVTQHTNTELISPCLYDESLKSVNMEHSGIFDQSSDANSNMTKEIEGASHSKDVEETPNSDHETIPSHPGPQAHHRDNDSETDERNSDSDTRESKTGEGSGDQEALDDPTLVTLEPSLDINPVTTQISSDHDLEDFFSGGQRSWVTQGQGFFPALDLVDLEPDEEGQQEVKKDMGGGGVEVHISQTENVDLSGDDTFSEGVKVGNEEFDLNKDQSSQHVPTVVVGTENTAAYSPPQLTSKDYPLNYHNYRMCRELRPGVEECLILETGEQFICVTNLDASLDERSVTLISACNTGPFQPQVSGDWIVEHPPTQKLDPADFAGFAGSEGRQVPQEIVIGHSEEVYITDNGFPIIMDNAEDETSLTLHLSHTWGDSDPEEVPRHSFGYENQEETNLFCEEIDKTPTLLDFSYEEQTKIQLKREEKFPSDSSETYSENELPPTEPLPASSLGNSNNNNRDVRMEDINVSNNADDKMSDGEDFGPKSAQNTQYTHSSLDRSEPTTSTYSSYESRSHKYSYDPTLPRSSAVRNIDLSPKKNSYQDIKSYRPREDTSYYRPAESSSVESTVSTRYTHMELGDPGKGASRLESTTIPRFKTLQDQQMSWLEMFKMIEEQHKCDLHTQYMEHQRILQEMQRNMERELSRQQESLKKRLCSHREILEELSPAKSGNFNQSSKSDEEEEGASSHTTLLGVPVSLRNPPPLQRYLQKDSSIREVGSASPVRQSETSINLSRSSVGVDKQLRGGVYSSPSPLAKVKHKNSPRGSKSFEDTHNALPRENHSRNSVHWAYDAGSGSAPGYRPVTCNSSVCDSDDVLSPRTRIGLKEKHAKHLADLKAYYEEELKEMRQLLAARQDRMAAEYGMTAGEKILSGENQELRQKCKELQDELHDSRVEIRELQQKIQGLDIRASDYAERFDTSQSQVLSLKSRLEEVTEFAKEKEAQATEVEMKHKKTIEALQMAYKKENELTESLHNAKITIQRLVDKYEMLEKDHVILKETLSATEEKLFTLRSEAMEASSKLSKLEHEAKQLKHDNDVLKHEKAIACSNQILKTSYEEAFSPTSPKFEQSQTSYISPVKSRTRSADRAQYNNSSSPDSDADPGFIRSPILRAERELRNLQKSFSNQEFTPKLQKKFYGSEVTPGRSGLSYSSKTTISNGHAPTPDQAKRLLTPSRQVKAGGDEAYARTPPHLRPREADKGEIRYRSQREAENRVTRDGRVKSSPSKKSSSMENGMSSEQAVEKVKSGEITSRPAWEDVYTSMAAPARQDIVAGKLAAFNSTREMLIKERMQTIESLEKKYSDLGQEKRRYESALSKLPAQGHRAEKDKLETELDRVDRELGSVRMSLKRYHVLKSTI